MKKLLLIPLALGALAVLVFVVVAYNAERIITTFKPQIEKAIVESLGASVNLGELELALFPSIAIKVPQIKIGDQTVQNPVSIETVYLQLDWLPLLSGRAVGELEIVKPKVTIKKEGENILVSGLNLSKQPSADQPPNDSTGEAKNKSASQVPQSPLALDVRSIKITDGELTLENMLTSSTPTPILINDIDLSTALKLTGDTAALNGLSLKSLLGDVGEVNLNCTSLKYNLTTLHTEWQNLVFTGPGIKLDSVGEFTTPEYKVKLNNSDLQLSELLVWKKLVTVVEQIEQSGLNGLVNVNLAVTGQITDNTLPKADGEIKLSDIGAKVATTNINKVNGIFGFSSKEDIQYISLPKLSAEIASPDLLLKPLPVNFSAKSTSLKQRKDAAALLLDIENSDWQAELLNSVITGSFKGNLDKTFKSTLAIKEGSRISLETLKEYLKGLSPVTELSGELLPVLVTDITPDNMGVSGKGYIDLQELKLVQGGSTINNLNGRYNVTFNKSGAEAKTEGVKFNLNDQPLNFKGLLLGSNGFSSFQIANLILDGMDGKIEGLLKYDLPGSFGINLHSASLGLPPLVKLAALKWLPETTGTLGPIKINLQGKTGTNLLGSLNGAVAVEAEDTILKGFNLAGAVLSKLNTLSILSGGFTKSAPEILNEYSNKQDTIVKKINFNGTINEGILDLSQAYLLSDVFDVEGKGKINLPTNKLDLATQFSFTEDFTKRVGAKVKEIERISATDGRLSFPLNISGQPPKMIVLPDIEGLLKLAARKAIKNEANKLLDKALEGTEGKEVLEKLLPF
jgi:hypothetical protein